MGKIGELRVTFVVCTKYFQLLCVSHRVTDTECLVLFQHVFSANSASLKSRRKHFLAFVTLRVAGVMLRLED